MTRLTGFGSALALAVGLGALPLAAAHADKAAEAAAKQAYEEAKAGCAAMSSRDAQAECFQQADQDYKVAMKEAKKK